MNFIEALDIKDIQLSKDSYTAKMCLGEFHKQPFGFVNGGAILAFAEITAGYASNLFGQGKYHALGQSINGNHLKAKQSEGYLYAEAELLHKGNRNHVWSIRISDEQGLLISQVTVVNALIMSENKESNL